ncbi:MAG TPA: hypothetical protein VKV74_17705, partial [Bryobacteraceae bacterium]|nr:hypothetical protein [Bryobacteraceae bacterium]
MANSLTWRREYFHNANIETGTHRMKPKHIVVSIAAVAALAAGTVASVRWSQRDVITVQTAKVVREDLTSIVTASGEIKPRNYINLG